MKDSKMPFTDQEKIELLEKFNKDYNNLGNYRLAIKDWKLWMYTAFLIAYIVLVIIQ